MEEIKITLKGDIASNKNSMVTRVSNAVITYLRKLPAGVIQDKKKTNEIVRAIAKFSRLTHTKKYKDWFADARRQIAEQVDWEPLWDDVHIYFTIYFPRQGKAGGDNSNKQQSIEDVLTECAIIEDDHYQCLRSYTTEGVYREGEGGAEIIIKKMS